MEYNRLDKTFLYTTVPLEIRQQVIYLCRTKYYGANFEHYTVFQKRMNLSASFLSLLPTL